MKNIIIAGGGTAGWLTALYVNRVMPDQKVILIESEEIGILGAGEGSTPHLISFLKFLNIPAHDIIQKCDATIKNGIKFTNWNNDGKFYYHGFDGDENISFKGIDVDPFALSLFPSVLSAVHFDEDFSNINFTTKMSEKNKVPFIVKENTKLSDSNVGKYSLHFNATKLAKRLSQIARIRGVKRIEGKIVDVVLDNNNDVSMLILDNGDKIKTDFVFDCTGFQRLIIGKVFNSKWHGYHEYLPVDSALPFFIPSDKEPPPYTESIAMKYGWIWKIPLQNRYGCGYVYDSSLLSEEDAAKEVEEYLGFEPEYPRKNKGSFKFNAGYFEEAWINNCMAVGLAGGFIEPLEATSIFTSILFLRKILNEAQFLDEVDQRYRDDFNQYFKTVNDEVFSFIYFHYMTERKDTEFWKKFTYDNAPKDLKNIIDRWKYRIPNFDDSNLNSIWHVVSWVVVAEGLNSLNKNTIKKYVKNSYVQKILMKQYNEFKNNQNQEIEKYLSHNNLLEKMYEI